MLVLTTHRWLDLVKYTDRNARDTRESKISTVDEPPPSTDPRALIAAQFRAVQGWYVSRAAQCTAMTKLGKCRDTHRILSVLIMEFDRAFQRFGLTPRHRSLLFELRQTRHDWAHQSALSDEEVWRALDNAVRLLAAVGTCGLIGGNAPQLICCYK